MKHGEGCTAVCDKLIQKLKAAGYKIDNKDQAHADAIAALDRCIKPERKS